MKTSNEKAHVGMPNEKLERVNSSLWLSQEKQHEQMKIQHKADKSNRFSL